MSIVAWPWSVFACSVAGHSRGPTRIATEHDRLPASIARIGRPLLSANPCDGPGRALPAGSDLLVMAALALRMLGDSEERMSMVEITAKDFDVEIALAYA